MAKKNVLTPTPHNEAKLGDIAPIVLMPGDPLRAKFIAESYLKNYQQVNSVRGMLAYTGEYEGKRISVMGHGMGIPSIGIYSHELFNFYNVKTIIRVGSCGAFLQENKLGDVIIADEAVSYSNYAEMVGVKLEKPHQVSATKTLIDKAKKVAKKENIEYFEGIVNSSDVFYGETDGKMIDALIKDNKIIAVEMEAYALYINALKANKKALALLTVSDVIPRGEKMNIKERETSFHKMIRFALEIVKTI